MRSRALSAHVKTEELPLPASMSVPTHSVCLTRLTPIGRKKQWILEPGTENSGSFWSRLTDRQRYLSSNLSPAHLLPPSSMTQKQTRPAAHGTGAVVWEARGQCGAEVGGGAWIKKALRQYLRLEIPSPSKAAALYVQTAVPRWSRVQP